MRRGNASRRFIAGWAIALAAAAGAFGTAAAPASAAPVAASITMSPKFAPPTTPVALHGTAFGAGDHVTVLFGDKQVADATADQSGAFSTTFEVPKGAPPGQQAVTADGSPSGRSARSTFTVRTNWAQLGFDTAKTFDNPYENLISSSTVHKVRIRWKYRFARHLGTGASPAVAAGIVYASDGYGDLSALDAATGQARWTVTLDPRHPIRTVTVTSDTVFASSEYGVHALDRATGAERWDFGLFEPDVVTEANGLVYVGGFGGLYALDPATGVEQWWTYQPGTSPAVSGGDLFLGGSDKTVVALDGSTGAVLWRVRVDGVPSIPSVAGGLVYAATNAGTVYALRASDGHQAWRTATGEAGTHSAVAVAGRAVFVGAASSTYALDASSGTVLWQAPVGGATPIVASDVVFAGSRAFDAATGDPLWDPRLTSSGPIVADGVIYLATKRILYAFGR